MTTHFMTYGTAAFTDRARNLADSASAVGFDTTPRHCIRPATT